MRPRRPYGCAKAFATNLARVYRDAYGLFVCAGITYNHESPRRGESFVTRKITSSVARIKAGRQECLFLGNLNARRDWGYAPEYTDAMWRMLQQDHPQDYLLATGHTTSVRDFVSASFRTLGVELLFEGKGEAEAGRDRDTGRVLVKVDPKVFRPIEPGELRGNSALASSSLGWTAQTHASQLADLMTRADSAAVVDFAAI